MTVFRRNLNLLLLGLTALGLTAKAQLIQWNTYGNAGTETSEASVYNDPNLSASSLVLGSGVNPSSNSNRFGGNNWFDTGDTNPTTLAESIARNDYIEFAITPSFGYKFTLTNLVFSWEHSSTGPSSLTARSSVDNYSSDLGTFTNTSTSLTTNNSITLSALSNISTAITIRLYGYGATGTTGAGGFDTSSNTVNVQLNGTVTAVPEPSTYAALLGLGTFAAMMLWRRKRHAAVS